MNYQRHFQLKIRATFLVLALLFCGLAGAVFIAIGWMVGPGQVRNAAFTVVCLDIVAGGAAALVLQRTFGELTRLEVEDREHNPWRSQPRANLNDGGE